MENVTFIYKNALKKLEEKWEDMCRKYECDQITSKEFYTFRREYCRKSTALKIAIDGGQVDSKMLSGNLFYKYRMECNQNNKNENNSLPLKESQPVFMEQAKIPPASEKYRINNLVARLSAIKAKETPVATS